MNRVGKTATAVKMVGGILTVKYHNTEVVTATNNFIRLDTGGWRTVTTKTRMNQASRQFDLGYTVYQKRQEWFVDYAGKTFDFGQAAHICLSRKVA